MNENVITVTGLTKYIKSVLENDVRLTNFTVSGEISNLTIHRTGHLYFAIKDENAVINAVMFRGSVSALEFKPENGMKIIAKGKISVFEPAGRYQVLVTSMEVDGIGDLYVAYELLKKKLEAEGLFLQSHKINSLSFREQLVLLHLPRVLRFVILSMFYKDVFRLVKF